VAAQSGIAAETLCRFEQGRVSEFGARKLMALLSVLGMEIQIRERGARGSLDELRKERGE
jgi:hypothetical protein